MASAPAIAPTSPARVAPPRSAPEAEACALPASVPEVLAAWMRPFRGYFTAAVWRHALVLVAGAVLAPGGRAGTAAADAKGLRPGAGLAPPPPRLRPPGLVFLAAAPPPP